jgi:hypothetical protein
MYDKFFAAKPEIFGFPEILPRTQESCFVPGYSNLTLSCKSNIAPGVLKKCSIFDNVPMSMEYEGSNDLILTEFCEFVDNLNTITGRKCLLDLCDYDPMANATFPTTSSPLPFPSSWMPAFDTTRPSGKPFSNNTSLPTAEVLSKPPTFSISFSVKPSPSPTATDNKTTNPFLTPVFNPSRQPSIFPTRHTTNHPSLPLFSPSKAPTQIPTQKSISPTISSSPFLLPSSNPKPFAPNTSQNPSIISFPPYAKSSIPTIGVTFTPSSSKNSIPYLVQIELYFTITLNFTNSHLPSNLQSFLDVMEIAIEEIFTKPISVSALVQSGSSLLQPEKEAQVDCKLLMNQECHHSDCNQYGHQIAEELTMELEANFHEGRLQRKIHELAKEKTVNILENAVIEHIAFEKETVKLEKADIDSDHSSSSHICKILIGFLVLTFSYALM